MAHDQPGTREEREPLTQQASTATPSPRRSEEYQSVTSVSTTSLVLESLNERHMASPKKRRPIHVFEYRDHEDPEIPRFLQSQEVAMSKQLMRIIWVVVMVGAVGWGLALAFLVVGGRYKHASQLAYDHENPSTSSGKKITLDEVQSGQWLPQHHEISWIAGPSGEDGLLLERGVVGHDYLVVEDIRNRMDSKSALASRVLMKGNGWFEVDGQNIWPDEVWPSPDLTKVLIMSKREKNWRHSSTGNYWIYDVEKQVGQPLDPGNPGERIQLASWAPTSDSIVFTRGNNMFLRIVRSDAVRQITSDGGDELFYGVPDWVYEEEVFSGNSATWWARDGQYVAFLRTNETEVPEYPVQYFISRPSGTRPKPGEESYPEVRQIKYPKAGAPNPTVDLQFYDVARAEVFSVNIDGGFADDDRLIIEVVWADKGNVLIRETNRESDITRLVLVDVNARTGKVVRTQDVAGLDGGWVEPTQTTRFVPADPANGRQEDGYIDTIIHHNNDHLAYFTPLDNPIPYLLTSGDWEVVSAPSALDLKNNLVYFVSTQQSPTQRHIYSVKLDGKDLVPIVPTDKASYYSASFSTGAGYALISYAGPGIPSQKIISTPSNPSDAYSEVLESNTALAKFASQHEMPQLVYSTVTVDNFTLQVVERRPAHFNPKRKYPVLFHLYGGPGSQTVSQRFSVDFQSYLASAHNIIVVTVDGRGTGFIGRKARCIIRGNIGHYEAIDQIATAQIWAGKPYVDATKLAIWGWSYGGFMTLKTLERDAGHTFHYGMAVAPVTDWRFYDSIYTERYMHTPQHNAAGYASSAITNVTALGQNTRWLVMHGVADDNVHMQSTLTLIDKLDLAQVENYDLMMFPDSDHSIYFHNANRVVYDKLDHWLRSAFAGVWEKMEALEDDGFAYDD